MTTNWQGGQTDEHGFRRARAGGEVGANGEFYKGGSFIATTDHPKGPAVVTRTPSAEAQRVQAEIAAEQARVDAWLAARQAQFAALIASLVATQDPAVYIESFYASLGRQLRESGSLSAKQADYVVKFVFGRETKQNMDARETLREALQERYERQQAAL